MTMKKKAVKKTAAAKTAAKKATKKSVKKKAVKKKAVKKVVKKKVTPPKLPKPTSPAGLIIPMDPVLIEEIKKMSVHEARVLVELYYRLQDQRIRLAGAQRSVQQDFDAALTWDTNMVTRSLCIDMSKEKQVGEALEIYAQQHAMGRWAMAIYGVAGIISAGLLAHIDMDLAKTPGHIFAYAGMAPGVKWIGSEKSKAILKAEGIAPKSDIKLSTEQAMTALAKGSELSGVKLDNLVSRAEVQDKERNNLGYYTGSSLYKSLSRRPWNAEFKVLCWKIGQSFIKTQNKEKDVYGHIFAKRKAEEMLKNKNGAYKKQAEAILKASPGHKQGDEFYSKGMLPDSHIMSRAARYATKIFLSHWWEIAYEVHNGVKPPFQPYPLDILGHAHKIEPPKSLTDLDDEDGVAV